MVGGDGGSDAPPESGKLVQVRNRPAVVTSVKTFRGQEEVHNVVEVEYLDGHDHPTSEQLIWDLEPSASALQNAGWPSIPSLKEMDPPSTYEAYLDSVQWSSLQSIQDLFDEGANLPLVSPWASAVQIEPYQLTPLLKALNMPRVSLLLADDVGLGKTIQAGLIATELMIRRRIKRIMVVCPASLQVQWQEEMEDKFHLDFTILDADEARRTQRDLGSDVNPWAVHNRIITSMDYLRQEVIYDKFEAAATKRQQESGTPFAPWDLLIVDEAHHFSPKDPTDPSLRSKMMRKLTDWFEHRVFLTATPHNGFTMPFLGLMELLDPLRFTQRNFVSDVDRRHIETVMVRRLKREINEASSVQRFPDRNVHGIPVDLTRKEQRLYEALREYRERAHEELAKKGRQEQNWGNFIFALLTKRLLSSPYAFARTWWRHVAEEEFAREERVTEADVEEAIREAERVQEGFDDDLEREDRERFASEQGGSWLLEETPTLRGPAETVSNALRDLGWDLETTAAGPTAGVDIPDSKIDALVAHLADGFPAQDVPPLVGSPDDLSDQERVIVFTEYKDTQDQIIARLREEGYPDLAVRAVFGGMSRKERDEIKKAFNDPDAEVRILVGTDAASEGLNLQSQCRYVSHFDIPWNPMKLEQRNGRVDRHGQARDVHVFHYTSDEEADQEFLAYVLNKVHEAREDLGSVGTVIDEGIQDHFWGGGVDQDDLDDWVEEARKKDPAKEDLKGTSVPKAEDFQQAKARFQKASDRYDLSETSIRNVIERYLEHHNAELEESNRGYRIRGTSGGKLESFLQDNLADTTGAMPQLVFDPDRYVEDVDGRAIYRPIKGTRLIRLGHPLTETAVSYFRRAMWGQEDDIKRWTMVGYDADMGNDAYVQLHFLVTARNDLQEVVHADTGSWWFHITSDGLRHLDEAPAVRDPHPLNQEEIRSWHKRVKPAFVGYASDVKPLEDEVRNAIRDRLESQLDEAAKAAEARVKDEFEQRLKELREKTLEQRREQLREMLVEAEEQAKQMTFSEKVNKQRQRRVERLRQQLDEESLQVWVDNQEMLKDRLLREQQRFIEEVLPKRYALSDTIEIVQVGARVCVPDGGGT